MFESAIWLQSESPQTPPPRAAVDGEPPIARTTPRVLVVDDESLIADTLAAILNESGFSAAAAHSGEQALEVARDLQPDIVLTDVLMPRMSGVELGISIRKEFPRARVVLFSGQAATSELMDKARADGYEFELFAKPIHPEELLARLRTR